MTEGRADPARRVASWVWDVLNPLIESLPVELAHLDAGDISWRFHNRTLEHVRPITDYINPRARHVLRDFRRADGDVDARFARHDELVAGLLASAARAHDALLVEPGFVEQTRGALADFEADRVKTGTGSYPGGAISRDRFPALVAERVINDVARVPARSTDVDFWERYGSTLLAWRGHQGLASLAPARERLVEFDHEFEAWLQDRSFELCTRHGIPAAPSAAMS